ncbi:MAG: hypothetical protein M3345_05880, partial [Actinomycetota bacterium]|nr:hypothetical protein [Actinomycetota bacterium]
MKRLKLLAGIIAFSCLTLAGDGAWSHDHRPPPDPALTIGAKRQVGRPIHITWRERVDENECELSDGFDFTTFPSATSFPSGSDGTIVLRKKSPPREWQLQVWRSVTRKGRPKGQPERILAGLVPQVGSAPPDRWELRFVPPSSADHLYLRLDVFWADEEGCASTPDLGSQIGSWTYHLRVRG